eukprot:6682275-Heterocapsa_arctica.AAC.1
MSFLFPDCHIPSQKARHRQIPSQKARNPSSSAVSPSLWSTLSQSNLSSAAPPMSDAGTAG